MNQFILDVRAKLMMLKNMKYTDADILYFWYHGATVEEAVDELSNG